MTFHGVPVVPCTGCDGSGARRLARSHCVYRCPTCGGTGWVERKPPVRVDGVVLASWLMFLGISLIGAAVDHLGLGTLIGGIVGSVALVIGCKRSMA